MLFFDIQNDVLDKLHTLREDEGANLCTSKRGVLFQKLSHFHWFEVDFYSFRTLLRLNLPLKLFHVTYFILRKQFYRKIGCFIETEWFSSVIDPRNGFLGVENLPGDTLLNLLLAGESVIKIQSFEVLETRDLLISHILLVKIRIFSPKYASAADAAY